MLFVLTYFAIFAALASIISPVQAEAGSEVTLRLQPRAISTITKTTTTTKITTVTKASKTITQTKTKTTTVAKLTITKTSTVVKTTTITKPAITVVKTSTVTRPASTITSTTTKSITLPAITKTSTTTKTITLPASTLTKTATVTVTASPISGPPGYTNVPNALFEQPLGTSDWCANAPSTACRLVQKSQDTLFSGLYGPGMLAVNAENEALSDFLVPVQVTSYPNPAGRNWILTASYRADEGNPGGCWPMLGWLTANGNGFGSQPNAITSGGWRTFSVSLPGSAQGTSEQWNIYVISACQVSGWSLYVDGIAIN